MSTPVRSIDDRFATAQRSEAKFHPYKKIGVGQGPPSLRHLHQFGMEDLDITKVNSPNFDVPAHQTTFLPHVQGTLPNDVSAALPEFKMWLNSCLAGESIPPEWVASVPNAGQVADFEHNLKVFMYQVMSPSCGLLKKEALMRSASVVVQFIWCSLKANYDPDFKWIGQAFDVAREPVVRCDKHGSLHYFDPQGNCVSVPGRGQQWHTNIGFPHLEPSPRFQTCVHNPHSVVFNNSSSAPPPGQPASASGKSVSPIGKMDEFGPSGGDASAHDEDHLNDDGDPIVPDGTVPPVAKPNQDMPFPHANAFPFRVGGATSSASASGAGVAGEYLASFAHGNPNNTNMYIRNDRKPGLNEFNAKFQKKDKGGESD
eukprot:g18183.t1